MKKLQIEGTPITITLNEDTLADLESATFKTGKDMADVVRECIDAGLPRVNPRPISESLAELAAIVEENKILECELDPSARAKYERQDRENELLESLDLIQVWEFSDDSLGHHRALAFKSGRLVYWDGQTEKLRNVTLKEGLRLYAQLNADDECGGSSAEDDGLQKFLSMITSVLR